MGVMCIGVVTLCMPCPIVRSLLTQSGLGYTMQRVCQQAVVRRMTTLSIQTQVLIWFSAAAGNGWDEDQ